MKYLLFSLVMLCLTHATAQQLIQSDDFFKDDNQRFIQTNSQQISHKEGITASAFFGVSECSNRADTIFSLYFSIPVTTTTTIEKGSMIVLNFADGTTASLPDQQPSKTVSVNSTIAANCYLDEATWKKIMQVDLTKVIVNAGSQEFDIRIPHAFRHVIPGMVRLLYERGRAPFAESL
ncbi:MAG: hypothetical protein IPP72_19855 [Chitinophagaceae bacterium]|nr:hypothetical protein [Chitinophagaceae bacterium]